MVSSGHVYVPTTTAYTQQSTAKMQMAALKGLPPMSRDYLDKLAPVKGAIAHHVYEEEGNGSWISSKKRHRPIS